MRIIHLVLTGLFLALAPITAHCAGATTSVRAIAFVASNDRGATDPRLAPYESQLRSVLRFESFKYVGESSASVSPGGKASISVPGGRVDVEGVGPGNVQVRYNGTTVPVSPNRPAAVFLGGQTRGGASGVIVTAN